MNSRTRTAARPLAAAPGHKRRDWVTLWLANDPDLSDGLERIAAYLETHPDERPIPPTARPRRKPGRIDAIRAAVRELLTRLDREQA